MGEFARVDLDGLRAVADRFDTAADGLADIGCPQPAADELRGSAVGAAVAAEPVTAQLRNLSASLRAWAHAARESAVAFERADTANGERLAPR